MGVGYCYGCGVFVWVWGGPLMGDYTHPDHTTTPETHTTTAQKDPRKNADKKVYGGNTPFCERLNG